MDEKGIDQAVTAFFRNDPFYPRPYQPLWKEFRDQYLQTSSDIISGDHDN
jgi:Zinc finger protein